MTIRRNGIVARLVPLRRRLQGLQRPPATRRLVLHVGAHKTGTTSLQYLLESNHLRLPRDYDLIRRNEAALVRLKRLTHALKSPQAAAAAAGAIRDAARALAESAPRAAVTLVSHEDIVGQLPTRGGVKGLYPFAPAALSAILAGIRDAGVAPEVVFYIRDWADWKASVFHYKNRDAGPEDYSPGYQASAHDLPAGWDALVTALRAACGAAPFTLLKFEDDRARGMMGIGYLRAAGLSEAQIARLRKVAPRNVNRPETVRAARAPR